MPYSRSYERSDTHPKTFALQYFRHTNGRIIGKGTWTLECGHTTKTIVRKPKQQKARCYDCCNFSGGLSGGFAPE